VAAGFELEEAVDLAIGADVPWWVGRRDAQYLFAWSCAEMESITLMHPFATITVQSVPAFHLHCPVLLCMWQVWAHRSLSHLSLCLPHYQSWAHAYTQSCVRAWISAYCTKGGWHSRIVTCFESCKRKQLCVAYQSNDWLML
jgi:hypothetical protein